MGAPEVNTTLIYGIHIRESANDGSDFTNAAADYRVLFLGEDGELHKKDSSGTVTAFAGSGIAATIGDAKGDLVGFSAADTPARVVAGTVNGDVLERDSAQSSGNRFVPWCGASYTSDAAQSFTSGTTLVIVDYEDLVFDPGSDVTTGASWHFTAPEAGQYLVTAHIGFASSTAWSASSERGVLQVFKNTSFHRTLDRRDGYISAGGAVILNLGGSCVVTLAASDTVDIRASQNSGSTIALDGTSGNNYVDIVRLR
jgi:hypothetical protein